MNDKGNPSAEDKELRDLLKPFSDLQPARGQVKRWSLMVQTESEAGLRRRTIRPSARVLQLAAAVFVGFILGSLVFKKPAPENVSGWQQNAGFDATFEHTHTNLD